MQQDFRTTIKQLIAQRAKVLVVGLGISGIESAKFLKRVALEPVCIEKRTRAECAKFEEQFKQLEALGIVLHFGLDGEKVANLLNGIKFCVLSPGVSLESAVCAVIKRSGVQMVNELELGVELLAWNSVVVTGSNGKSTTVSLIEQMLKGSGYTALLCGNVGIPVVASVNANSIEQPPPRASYLVVEASSYQLETSTVLKPKVAVFLNISDNHLERHGNIERYFAVKSKLFTQQDKSDYAILNIDDVRIQAFSPKVKAQLCPVSSRIDLKHYDIAAKVNYEPAKAIDQIEIRLKDHWLQFNCSSSKLLGLHNRYDLACALLASSILGATQDVLQKTIDTFIPLEHRIEVLTQRANGARVVNDSKSTTVASTQAAFSAIRQAYPNDPVILMIGGLSKAGSWRPLIQQLKNSSAHLKQVICFGKDARILASHCKEAGITAIECNSVRAGLERALDIASSDNLILFSPGCASFDEFMDFEHRGREFKRYLHEIMQHRGSQCETA